MAAGSVVIDLLMKTGSFETDTKRAEKRLKDFEKSAKRTGEVLGNAFVVATGAVAALTTQYVRNAEQISVLANLSGLSAERFQELAYASQTVGIQQEKLSDIFKDVQDRIGDFLTTGAGPMADFFEKIAPQIGVTIDQFKNLSGSEALGLFYRSLERANLSQSEMIFFMEQMASDSSLLIPLLQDNARGFEQLAAEAQKAGSVMSNEGIKSAIEFKRELDKLIMGVKALGQSIVEDLLPPLNTLIEGLNAGREASLWGWLFTSGQEEQNAAKQIQELEQSLENVRGTLETHKKWQQDNPMFAWAVGGDVKDLETQVSFIEEKLKYLRKVRERQDKEYWQNNTINMPSSFIPTIDLTAPAANAATTSGAGNQAAEVARSFIEVQSEYDRFIDQITGRAERARQEQEEGWLALAKSVGDISAQEYETAIEKIRDVESQMSQFAISAARNIQGVLGDGIYNFLSGRFDDIGQSFLNMLNRMLADLMSSQISQLLFGNFGTSNQVGGLVGQIGNAIGSVIGGMVGGGGAYTTGNTGPAESYYGFANGGYTGMGGKYEPAGVVHRGEFVMSADTTKRLGIGFLDRLNKGYANGGYVGNMPSAMSGNVNINIKNEAGADGYQATAQARQNTDGGLNIDVLVRRVVASDISNNGALAQQMANTFGLRRAI